MKIKNFSFICLIILLIFSCRKEESEFIQSPTDETLTANSIIADLMEKTSINDGSKDNIIDKSNCFNIKFPVTVIVNGNEVIVNSDDDYKIVEYIFDDNDDDNDSLEIIFPITIILEDFSESTINSLFELNNYTLGCNGENEYDDDIECLDFIYPIKASVFNNQSEIINTETFNSDNDLNYFINQLSSYDFATLNFPINVALADGTLLITNNLNELEHTINTYKNDCDEDDDYDYNDDDCNDCSIDELTSFLTGCSGWTIDKLDRYGNDYDDIYYGYTFNFDETGNISVYWSGKSVYGTWVANGSGNNIIVSINVPDLPFCNNDWLLHEISQYTETKIDLRVENDDRMRYKNDCN